MSARTSTLATVLAIVVASALIGLAARPAVAGAVTTAYADGDGARHCASLTPCYTTIQAAVNNVNGPGDAEVLVFPGTYNESVNLANMGSASTQTLGNIALRTVDAAANPVASTATIHGSTPITTGAQPFPKDVTIDGFVLEATQNDGAFIHTTSSAITITHVTSDDPGDGSGGDGDDGLDLETTGGFVTIDQSETKGAHGALGDGIQLVTGGGAMITNTTASENSGTQDNLGMNIADSQGDIMLQDVAADENYEYGIYVYTTGTVSVSGRANDNGFRGVDVFTELGFAAANVLPQGRPSPAITFDGLQVLGNEDDGGDAQAGGDIVLKDSFANGNAGRGFQLLSAGSVNVTNTHTSSNQSDGIYIEAEENATIRGVSAINNGATGDKPGLHVVGFGAELGSVSIEDSLVMQNHGNGVDLFNLDAAGTHDVASNVICGNVKGGLRNNGTILTLPAEGNWWGDPTGPKSNANPGGKGDAVNLGGDGTIDFDAWITQVVSEADPAGAGTTSQVQYQFADADKGVLLHNGPGDELGSSPFTLSASNGTAAAATNGFIVNTNLTYDLTPAATGSDVLTLTGPCGLDSETAVDVGSGFPRGDLNCDGNVDVTDATRSLRYTSGLDLTDIPGCGVALGSYDLDCGGTADGRDPLLLLLKLADLPALTLPQNCPALG